MHHLTSEAEDTDTLLLAEAYFIIDPRRFHYLKFILEGYDNLAVLSSASREKGLVRIRVSYESYPQLITLLANVASQILKKTH